LLPSTAVGEALSQIREALSIRRDEIGDVEILLLARLYGVSFEVAARRCEDLSLIPPGGSSTFVQFVKARHGGPEKYADHLGLPPRSRVEIPRISRKLLDVAFSKSSREEVSISWLSQKLGVSIDELNTLHASWFG
jgi:hypothetical protein